VLNHRIKVKVCGITRAQDAADAVALGVDAIGMILHANSPRVINVEAAQLIRQQVPAFVTLVGVFVNADLDLVNRYVSEIGLDLVQLHGNEDDSYAKQLNAAYIKAIRAKSQQQVERDVQSFPTARALLFDPYVKGLHGGTGKQLDSQLWPKQAPHKMILAGGLNHQNIVAACATMEPYAVDLNSGVELEPGIKDVTLIEKSLSALGR